jgi:hypothetical protein
MGAEWYMMYWCYSFWRFEEGRRGFDPAIKIKTAVPIVLSEFCG